MFALHAGFLWHLCCFFTTVFKNQLRAPPSDCWNCERSFLQAHGLDSVQDYRVKYGLRICPLKQISLTKRIKKEWPQELPPKVNYCHLISRSTSRISGWKIMSSIKSSLDLLYLTFLWSANRASGSECSQTWLTEVQACIQESQKMMAPPFLNQSMSVASQWRMRISVQWFFSRLRLKHFLKWMIRNQWGLMISVQCSMISVQWPCAM